MSTLPPRAERRSARHAVPDDDEFLTVSAFCKLAGICRGTFYRQAKRGLVPRPFKGVTRRAAQDWLDQRAQAAERAAASVRDFDKASQWAVYQNDERPAPPRDALPKSKESARERVVAKADNGNECDYVVSSDGHRIPILDCLLHYRFPRESTNSVSFECPHCKDRPDRPRSKSARHWHGDPNGLTRKIGDLVGHRWAHCHDRGSPLVKTGYYLRIAEVETPEQAKKRRDAKVWQ